MKFQINPAVTGKFPDLHVGLLVCTGIGNGAAPAEVTGLLREAEVAVRAKYQDPEALKNHPNIAAWQEIHRAFGSNPNKFPSSVHALCKRVAKGGELPSINTLVDLYNTVSLRHMLPVGGEDLDRCRGDIVLTLAQGTEFFTPIGSDQNEPPEPGEAIYRDDEGVLCRKFNWREAARTCLLGATINAVLVIEAVPPSTRADLEAALEDLQGLVERFCGGKVERVVLHAHTLSHTLSYAHLPLAVR